MTGYQGDRVDQDRRRFMLIKLRQVGSINGDKSSSLTLESNYSATQKEMIIRVQTGSEKGHSKAIKVAAAISGVESVTIAGEDKDLLLVIGVGIDSDRITKKLRRKVGHAEVVELRTVDASAVAEAVAEHAYRYHASPSPYKHHHPAGARDHYYGGMDHYYAGGSPYVPPPAPPPLYYGGAGGYPAQYEQHDYFYHPAAANTHTVVHHEYASDPNGCSIM